jgi:hypothetical protein
MADSDKNSNQRNQYVCPFCNSKARIRSSNRITSLYAEGVVECTNIVSCGWRGWVATEILSSITPSLFPNTVSLPLSPYALKRQGKINSTTKNPFDPNRDQMLLFDYK